MNTEEMNMVDLNVDLGEDETLLSPDLPIPNCATSVNLSCGFHAGNQRVIRDGAIAPIEYGVVIGAHVSFPVLLTGEHRGSRIATVDV
jgi:UPF0271 protein